MRRFAASLTLLLMLGEPVPAQGVRQTLWIDARTLDLDDPTVRATLLAQPAQRLIVSCLEGGETIIPNQTGMFPQAALYRGKPDPLAALLAAAQEKGRSVYASLDCLHWVPAGSPKEKDLLAKHLRLTERDVHREFGPPEAGKFASPLNPQVVQLLRALVQEIAARYPRLDGLVLRCELSPDVLLGFSYPARMAYLREQQVDLYAIPPAHFGGKETDPVRAWKRWRAEKMASLVGELTGAFRSQSGSGKVALVSPVRLLELPPANRDRLLNEAPRWAQLGYADELILEWKLGAANNVAGYKKLRELATGRQPELTVLPIQNRGKAPYNPDELLSETRDQEIRGLAVRVGSWDDLAWLTPYQRQLLPRVEWLLPRSDLLALPYDPRLSARLTLELQQARMEDLLGPLRQATGLEFITSGRPSSDRPVHAGISLRAVAAWSFMRELARKVGGRWEKFDGGYRLILPPEEPAAAPLSTTTILMMAAGSQLVILLTLFLLWRRRRRQTAGA
jgi:hypothetical protein